jgi:hypothetical protein
MAEFKKNIQQHPGRYIGVLKDTDSDTTYTAGDGLDLSGGNEFSLDLRSNSGVVISSTELAIDLSASNIGGTLAVGDGGTGAASFTDNAILSGTGTSPITAEDTSIASGVISRAGTIEMAGTTVTLDSAGDIELEVGATSNYVQTLGLYRGGNAGYYSDTYIPLMPIDFCLTDDYRSPSDIGNDGQYMEGVGRKKHYAQKIIPAGYTATQCVIYGVDADGDANFTCFEGQVTGTTPAARCASTAINSTATFAAAHSNIVGDGLKFCTIQVAVTDVADRIYGGKIILTRTT